MDQKTLKLADFPETLEGLFRSMRTLPREKLINVMLQLAVKYFTAICPPGSDPGTLQVLAIHEVAELLRAGEDFFAATPGEDAESVEEIVLQ